MLGKILRELLRRAGLNLYTSKTPKGRRLGGTDIISEPDRFIILEVSWSGVTVFEGYWQTS